MGRLPSGWLRLGARPGRRSLGLSSLRELAAPSLAPQGFRESPPRFLPPRPAPARPRSGRAAREARAQAWKPADPAPTGPAPSGHPDEQRLLPAAERQVGGRWATGRARWGCGLAFRPRGRQGAREGVCPVCYRCAWGRPWNGGCVSPSPGSLVLQCSTTHSFNSLLTECQLRARHCKYD